MSVIHRWHSNRPNNPEKEVSSTEWNAAHIVGPKSIPLNAIDAAGTATASTVLHGDGTWKEPTGGGAPVIPDGSITMAKLSTTGTPSSTTFLNGNGVWTTPTGGGGGSGPNAKMHYQYLIYLDGTTAIAVDSTGTQIASNTNHAAVIQAIINLNPTGIIALGPGQFTINTSLKLQNDRSYNILGSGGFIDSSYVGIGIYPGTMLMSPGDTTSKIFEIVYSQHNWSSRTVTIRDLNLRNINGYGLYCNMPETNLYPGGRVSPRFNLQDIALESRVGLYINTLYNSFFKNLTYYSEQPNSRMIHLTHTSPGSDDGTGNVNTSLPFHCGNSNFFGVFGSIGRTNSIGIEIDQTGGTGWINEISFWGTMLLGEEGHDQMAGIQFTCNTANSGNIAMIMFNDMRIETFQHAIRLLAKPTAGLTPYGKILNCTFNNLYCNSYTAKDVIASGANAFYDVTFNDALMEGSMDFSATNNSGYDTPIIKMINCVPSEVGSLTPPAAGPYIVVGDGIRVKTSHAGTYTGTSVTVNHGIKLGGALPMSPSCVAVTPISSGITSLSVTNITPTSFTVTCTPSGTFLAHAWLNFPNP
jgi:hypothetical protein